MSNVVAAIFENDIERARKTCIALDAKVTGANRELAQWLVDNPKFTAVQVSIWLDCGETRILDLRRWAAEGFLKSPSEKRRERGDSRARPDEPRRAANGPLKSLDNSSEEPEESDGDPAGLVVAVTKNATDKANIAARNLEHDFTPDQRKEIIQAIDNLIRKWTSLRRKMEKANG